MSIIQIMVTIIIVTILVTVILGVASYAAYWLRRGRRPAGPTEVDDTPRYFYRYMPEEERIATGASGEQEPASPEPQSTRLDVEEVVVGQSEGNGRTGY